MTWSSDEARSAKQLAASLFRVQTIRLWADLQALTAALPWPSLRWKHQRPLLGHLKINRAIATRYDQLASSFLGMVHLATARY